MLSDVDLDMPPCGIVTLIGPTGTGKSTLLRTIAGFNQHTPSLRTWGSATYRGEPLGEGNSPVLVSQNTRLLTATLLDNLLYGTAERFAATPHEKKKRALENLAKVGLERYRDSLSQPVVELPLATQRLVAIARAIATAPDVILIDEPTFGLEEEDASLILSVIRRQAEERAVLVVLHNQRQVRTLGGTVALLAGGVIQEVRSTKDFFDSPGTPASREFIDHGTCSEPSPDARSEDLDTGIRPRMRRAPERAYVASEAVGPRGFVWLLPGKLAGTPRPGVVADIDYDLDALKRVGVTALISLTSTSLDEDKLADYGIKSHWFPIPDMGAPSIVLAERICTTIDRLLRQGEIVAVHCRAGHGRTGTVLVAYLIWQGRTAIDALETARRFEPKWVQSETQINFLEELSHELHPAPIAVGVVSSGSP